jgi:hypothetical protein
VSFPCLVLGCKLPFLFSYCSTAGYCFLKLRSFTLTFALLFESIHLEVYNQPILYIHKFGMVNLQHHLSVLATLVYGLNVVLAGHLGVQTKRAISPDNTCGKNGTGGGADGYMCPSELPCCSVNGFCGSTNEYCLTTAGCQSAFGNCTAPAVGTVSPDETCGVIGAGTAGYTCSTASSCCSGK